MKVLIIICLSSFLFFTSNCCLRTNNEKVKLISTMKVEKESIEAFEGQEMDEEQKYLSDIPINVNEVKHKFEKFTTSTLLSRSKSNHFYMPDTVGFYGYYTLVGDNGDNEKSRFVGELIVFSNEKTWVYNNLSDIFIEIVTGEPDLYVYDEINVGSDVAHLEKCLGKPKIIINDFYVYSNNIQNIAIFEIVEEKIKWIKIGRYNESIISNIDKNIYKLLPTLSER